MKPKSDKSNPTESRLHTVPATSGFPEPWWRGIGYNPIPQVGQGKNDSQPSSLRCSNGGSDSTGGQSQSDEGESEEDEEDSPRGSQNAASPQSRSATTAAGEDGGKTSLPRSNIRQLGMPSRCSFLGGSATQGLLFVTAGSISFVAFVYAAVVLKLLPRSDNAFISAVQKDRYYCFLVPLTLPILVVAVYFHWLSMKLFKHA